MKIVWTKHAIDRQKEWHKKLGITNQEVEDLVMSPEQIVQGDLDILVAQTKIREGILRAPFKTVGDDRKIITLYWTNKVERYWRQEER
jgi:hypothetical protein